MTVAPDRRAVSFSAKRSSRRRSRGRPATPHALEIFRGILDATTDLVAAHDLECRYLAFNQGYRAEFARIFGVELELGDSLLEALSHLPRDRARALRIVQRALRGEAFTVVQEFGDARRARRLFEIRYAPLRDRRGKLFGAAHIARDVTERQRARDALQEANATLERRVAERTAALAESEGRFRAAIDHFPGTFAIYDTDRRLRFVNATGLARIHLRAEELLGRREEEVLRPELIAPYLPARERAFETGETQRVEWTRRGRSGERTFVGTFVPLLDDGGRTRQVLGIAEEISARKRAEDALRRSEAILAQAGEMAHLGAWWIDIEGDGPVDTSPLHWSDEVYRIFGYAPGEVAVTSELFFARVPEEDHGRIRDAIGAAMANRRPYHLEHRVIRPDGTERVVLEHAVFVFDEAARPVRIVGAVLDITERKRVEEALREADRRKNEFLGVLSHELRNPLAPVRNALWLLDHTDADSTKASRAKEVMNRQFAHLSRIVDDLLDVTRITRGKIHLQKARLDVVELVLRTAEDHRTIFAAREVTLGAQLPRYAIWIDADPTRVAQAVGNLLHNAVKFTDAGGHVEVSVARDAPSSVRVAVRDDGGGIAPELLGRVFEPFTQADDSLHRTRGGLGLGLSLVKGLVELHGGSVEARSDGPGRGAELVLRLPLAPEQRVFHGAPRGAVGAMPSRRVLVVEDNADAAELLREMLEMWGHEVAMAADGRAGLERARAFRPDVVLCDIGLPVMDGYEVARAIRADPSIASTFLVAVTGYALPEDERRAAEAGFVRHLGKPVPIEVLEEVLATAPRLEP